MHFEATMATSLASRLLPPDAPRLAVVPPLPRAVPLEAPLGVQSELQLVLDAEGAPIGVFVPHAPTLIAGTPVRVQLTLGVSADSVDGVVAWAGQGSGPRVRRTSGLGILFPILIEPQRVLLRRARLLHEATGVPNPAAPGLTPHGLSDPDYELHVDDPDYELKVDL